MDLFINASLIATSVALFCYWFRYGCLLILTEAPHNYTEEVVEANQLSFPEVRSSLRRHDFTDLGSLHKCLERDFAIISYLLEHTPVNNADPSFDDAMVKVHFRAMSACFRLTPRNLHGFAANALEEMSLVVAHLANQFGERTAAAAQ